MKPVLLFIIITFIPVFSYTQATIKVTSVPQYYTPLLDTIFIAGTFNNWNPADPNYALAHMPDGTYEISITGTQDSVIEYKFTRNSWDNVETQIDGSYLPNRSFVYATGTTISVQVANWNDQLGWHTSVGNTQILDMDFYIPQLDRYRRIWIYLPPDYYTSNHYYPVMYMHDGQNLFDEVYAAFGEWDVDEIMDGIFSSFSPSAIIVGIDNSIYRLDEYSPWYNSDYGGGQGEAYADFIVNALKPFIDNYFRTISDREHTAIMGSSMGGLISFYAATEYQDVFSRAGIFSPSFWFSDTIYSFIQQKGHQADMKYYFLSEDNGSGVTENTNSVMTAMLANGFSSAEMTHKAVAGAEHNEQFWSSEYEEAFKWLFDGVSKIESPVAKSSISLFYDNDSKMLHVTGNTGENYNLSVFNAEGQYLVNKQQISNNTNLSFLKPGIYFVRVQEENGSVYRKIIIY